MATYHQGKHASIPQIARRLAHLFSPVSYDSVLPGGLADLHTIMQYCTHNLLIQLSQPCAEWFVAKLL
jgi:hypothetical protein